MRSLRLAGRLFAPLNAWKKWITNKMKLKELKKLLDPLNDELDVFMVFDVPHLPKSLCVRIAHVNDENDEITLHGTEYCGYFSNNGN